MQAVEAGASAMADAQPEEGSNGTPAAMCNVQGESIVWDPQQQASSWGSDAPGSSSDTGYHTRPSTSTSMYSTSAPVNASEPLGEMNPPEHLISLILLCHHTC
jgi:hypothetical protein